MSHLLSTLHSLDSLSKVCHNEMPQHFTACFKIRLTCIPRTPSQFCHDCIFCSFFFSLTVSRRLFYTWQWHWRKGELPLDTAREQNHSRVCIEHAPSRETQVKGTLNSPASDASVRAHIRVAQLEFFSAIQGA